MIDKEKIETLASAALADSDRFVIETKVSPGNNITITIDGDTAVTIDDCIILSKTIEKSLDRDAEDFELRVTSFGADSPLKLLRQYPKNIGRQLQVMLPDDQTVQGVLRSVTDEAIVLEPLQGRKKTAPPPVTIPFADIRQAKVILSFK
ncbi:MAG: ribosome assembly cofactor RimP [Bacteroidales bacterium]|jgi:ribosome maturation factor RimP|nr:ribosome assembly cofactor RimP [Bacteroidales bacterium]NCU36338.1 ribosome assembly cofactor RimP [Candidatus Falkowbacteria bacterium]MDD2632864.1 ribosome assembly cofactor RimP [Bacteroidales bacterium]MDD3526808.1 ribosome assembly cofactor RimP [Bacteroidales bacterium]MDD4177594.1 ribosome assembly cofactor RimP [Bacteroidales bacterium]